MLGNSLPAGPVVLPDVASDSRAEDRLALAFVLAVTAFCAWLAFRFVWKWAVNFPVLDDMELARVLVPGAKVTWKLLWESANEHRIPLTRLIFIGLLLWTRDFRSALHFEVATHVLLALALVFLVRRLRGHTRFADAFFPLFWLSLANADNFLLGMQISTDMATVLVMASVALGVWSRERPQAWRSVGLIACLLLLPTTGGFGLTQVPPLALWCALLAWFQWKDPVTRGKAWILIGGLGLLAIEIATYMHGLQSSTMQSAPFQLYKMLGTAGQVLTLNLGPAAARYPWFGIPATTLILVAGVALSLRALLREPRERWRAAMCLCALCAPVATALAIGMGRQVGWPIAGWATRYVTLPSPLFATAFVIFVLYGKGTVRRVLQGSLFITFVALHGYHHDYGNWYAGHYLEPVRQLANDARAGMPLDELGAKYSPRIYNSPPGLSARLLMLQKADMPPFRGLSPVTVSPPKPVTPESVLGFPFEQVGGPPAAKLESSRGMRFVSQPPGVDYVLAIPPWARRVRGFYGVSRASYRPLNAQDRCTNGMRMSAVALGEGGVEHELLSKDLKPAISDFDRRIQNFSFTLPEGCTLLRLRTSCLGAPLPDKDLGVWTKISFE